jgi:hypothetical protein
MNRMTFLLSATVLAGGLALSGAAYADHADGNALGVGNATGGGSSATSTMAPTASRITLWASGAA